MDVNMTKLRARAIKLVDTLFDLQEESYTARVDEAEHALREAIEAAETACADQLIIDTKGNWHSTGYNEGVNDCIQAIRRTLLSP
jgi:hypothetical protein